MHGSRVVGSTVFGVLVAGCYTYDPTTTPTPDIGKVLAFDVNDAGRVALGGSMGPEIAQVQGRLLSRDSDYVVGVTAVRLLRGGEQTWAGEPGRLKPAYVSSVYERHVSVTRTTIATVVGIGLAVALVAKSVLGGGSGG